MEIHCSAAISCRLRHRPVQKSSDRRAGSDGVLHANCPAKSYYFPATREAGLVQIANSLTEQCGHETFQISGFWADYGQSEPYSRQCGLLQPCPRLS